MARQTDPSLIRLLSEVLPDLMSLASGRSEGPSRAGADQARVYHPATCPRCTDAQPCDRARTLEGK
jgi:hypothetical protein